VRMLATILLSLLYFVLALVLAGFASLLTGDCWTERTRAGFDQCTRQGTTYFVAILALAAAGYAWLLWKMRRRK